MWKESVDVTLLQATIYERTLILTLLFLFRSNQSQESRWYWITVSLLLPYMMVWICIKVHLSPRDIQARIRSSSWIRWWIQLVCFSPPRTWHPQYTSHTSRCACHACCRKLPYMVSRPVARGGRRSRTTPPPPWRLKVHISAIHLVQEEWTHFWSWVDT